MNYQRLLDLSQQADKDNSDNQRRLALAGFAAVWLLVSAFVIYQAGNPVKTGETPPAAPSWTLYLAGALFALSLGTDALFLVARAANLRLWLEAEAEAGTEDSEDVDRKRGRPYFNLSTWLYRLRMFWLATGYLILAIFLFNARLYS